MADIKHFFNEHRVFKSTFKETSLDTEHSINLCNDESQEVINFDAIIKNKYPNSMTRPKSFDALFSYHGILFCIEFKNQIPSKIDNKAVKEKLKEGKRELVDLLQTLNVQIEEYDFVYCVAYRNCKEPIDRYKCGVGKGMVLFGLNKYKEQGLVKNVYTENIDFFNKEFKKQTTKELTC